MTAINRRFLLGIGGMMLSSAALGASAASGTAHLRIGSAALNDVPLDYNGFSVEKSQFADPSFYCADNKSLIALHRRLSTNAVLRIGGNTSEFCWWKASSDAAEPNINASGIGRADNWMPQHHVGITPQAVENLRAFLDACGWSCIWGLNFGTGTPALNAEEAAIVSKILGPRLRYFQIGNEPDLYMTSDNRLRPAGWGFGDYVAEWTAIAEAVSARVANAKFGGPDVSTKIDWVPLFTAAAQKRLGNRLVGISGHYYVGGPPSSPDMTIAHLLQRDPKVAATMDVIAPAVRSAGLPFRITEANSCYRGGKPGMSNTLAAALWGADYALYLASRGGKGIFFHGGPGQQIASSIGDKMPGAQSTEEMDYAKRGSFYSPFAGSPALGYEARPLFCGMMLVEQFAGTTLLANTLEAGNVNATAFVARTLTGLRIALINKEENRDLVVAIDANRPMTQRKPPLLLSGPGLAATGGISFAAHPTADGPALRNGEIIVPRASALLMDLEA
jgi:hypothetical protein